MPTVVLVEQRPPFILMLASRVPTYTHIVISFLAVLLIQAFPSWAIAKPSVREITRKRRSSSLTSNTSTLVDPIEADAAKKDMNKQGKGKRHYVSFSNKIPFNRLGSSVKMAISRSKSMKPKLPRRLSLPARRFSTHIVTALHNLTPHHHRRPQNDADSYFLNERSNIEDVNMSDMAKSGKPHISTSKPIPVSLPRSTKVEIVDDDVKQREISMTIVIPHKKTLKQAVRKASVILKDFVHRP
ncbi:hypothetical protein C0995_000537 [Termitomyces sp. Mi166|nr:hypothetical protein C0995_000537 [Termitomyces sp. Mi166\